MTIPLVLLGYRYKNTKQDTRGFSIKDVPQDEKFDLSTHDLLEYNVKLETFTENSIDKINFGKLLAIFIEKLIWVN